MSAGRCAGKIGGTVSDQGGGPAAKGDEGSGRACGHTRSGEAARRGRSSAAPQPGALARKNSEPRIVIVAASTLSCQEARCICRHAACKGCQKSTPLLDLSDPSTTQLTAGTMLLYLYCPPSAGCMDIWWFV